MQGIPSSQAAVHMGMNSHEGTHLWLPICVNVRLTYLITRPTLEKVNPDNTGRLREVTPQDAVSRWLG